MAQRNSQEIEKIKQLLRIRKSLIMRLSQLDLYGQKIQEVRKKYNSYGKS